MKKVVSRLATIWSFWSLLAPGCARGAPGAACATLGYARGIPSCARGTPGTAQGTQSCTRCPIVYPPPSPHACVFCLWWSFTGSGDHLRMFELHILLSNSAGCPAPPPQSLSAFCKCMSLRSFGPSFLSACMHDFRKTTPAMVVRLGGGCTPLFINISSVAFFGPSRVSHCFFCLFRHDG